MKQINSGMIQQVISGSSPKRSDFAALSDITVRKLIHSVSVRDAPSRSSGHHAANSGDSNRQIRDLLNEILLQQPNEFESVLNKEKNLVNLDDQLNLSSSDHIMNYNGQVQAFRLDSKQNNYSRSGNPNFVCIKIGVFEFFAKVETLTSHSDYF